VHPEPILLAFVVIKHFSEVTLGCPQWFGWFVKGNIVGLVEHLKNLCTMLIEGWEIEDLEQKGHHILTHDRGVETELDSRVSD
jgi:hypothetical protein